MKKAKITLLTIVVLAVVGGALPLKQSHLLDQIITLYMRSWLAGFDMQHF